ncbi:ABC transporter substrate-binding protein [Stella sp.]|uniref:ABC transporter substrate-binding protein n=1 Tax=Stella sp. TaxID=2912054 RepID=UPI0035B14DE8
MKTMRPAAAAAAILAAGLAGAAQAQAPIKIGLVLPYSAGPFVAIANEITDSMALALEESGYMAAGRKIELVREDTTHKPDVAQAKAKKLVFEDKVDMLVGPVASAELTALFDFAHQSKVPLLIPNAGDNEVTGEKCSPWVLRTSFSNDQIVRDMGRWMAGKGYRKVALLAFDYKAGHQLMGGFKKPFTEAGGTIVTEQYPPFGRLSDFGPWLGKIRDAKPDAVFTFFAGPPATLLVQQFKEFGLDREMKLTGAGWLVSPLNLPSQGKAAAGVIGALNYVPAIDNPVNKSYQERFQAKFKRVGSEFGAQGYDTAKLIHAAITQAGGKTDDKAALVKAMHAVRIEGTRGPLRIDPKTNNVIQDIYVFETELQGDKVGYKVVDRIRDVQDPPNGCTLGG